MAEAERERIKAHAAVTSTKAIETAQPMPEWFAKWAQEFGRKHDAALLEKSFEPDAAILETWRNEYESSDATLRGSVSLQGFVNLKTAQMRKTL